MYLYTWYQWLLFFFIYCFLGWIIESTYVSVRSRHFINRGFLRLPLLPLYGSGAIIMLWFTLPVKGNLALVFLFGMVGASALEYATGFAMERLFKMKYWDYSGNPFNLNGYICLGTSLAWGVLTIVLTELVHKPIEQLVLDLTPFLCGTAAVLTSILFTADAVRSTKEALDLSKVLESMTKLRAELEEAQLQMALFKAETAQKVSDFKDETIQRAANIKGETAVKLTAFKVETTAIKNELIEEASAIRNGLKEDAASALSESALAERLKALSDARERLSEYCCSYRNRILKGNPTVSSRWFGEALRDLKEYSKKGRHTK